MVWWWHLSLSRFSFGSCGMDSIYFSHHVWDQSMSPGEQRYILGESQEVIFPNQKWKKRHHVGRKQSKRREFQMRLNIPSECSEWKLQWLTHGDIPLASDYRCWHCWSPVSQSPLGSSLSPPRKRVPKGKILFLLNGSFAVGFSGVIISLQFFSKLVASFSSVENWANGSRQGKQRKMENW